MVFPIGIIFREKGAVAPTVITFISKISGSNKPPLGKQRGIKIPTAQGKSRSKLWGTNPERD
jgi:hypothetical protein